MNKNGKKPGERAVQVEAPASVEQKPPGSVEKKPAPRVAQCTRFMQRRVAAHLPGILEELLEKSKGDAATLKALWQMSKLDGQEAVSRKRKGSLAREILRGS